MLLPNNQIVNNVTTQKIKEVRAGMFPSVAEWSPQRDQLTLTHLFALRKQFTAPRFEVVLKM